MQGDVGGVGLQGGGHAGGDFVGLPGVQVYDLAQREQLGHGGREDAEVGAAAPGRFRTG